MANTVQPTIPMATGIVNLRFIVQTNATYTQTKLIPIIGNSSAIMKGFDDFFQELILGAYRSNINVMASGVYATGTATLASVVATNTIVIGGVTLTAVSSAPTNAQFLVGSSNSATATNLAAAINANTSLDQVVQASASGAVVTIACIVPGTIGNLVTLSAGGGTITVAAALAGGTDGVSGTISHGL